MAGLIRVGNFFNSEIIGKPTQSAWGVVFKRVDGLPRYPSQLFEAGSYLLIFAVMRWIYAKTDAKYRRGFFFGFLFVFAWSARFLWEFTKENQEAFESKLPLNMGQLLSLPLIAIGIWAMARSMKRPLAEKPSK